MEEILPSIIDDARIENSSAPPPALVFMVLFCFGIMTFLSYLVMKSNNPQQRQHDEHYHPHSVCHQPRQRYLYNSDDGSLDYIGIINENDKASFLLKCQQQAQNYKTNENDYTTKPSAQLTTKTNSAPFPSSTSPSHSNFN